MSAIMCMGLHRNKTLPKNLHSEIEAKEQNQSVFSCLFYPTCTNPDQKGQYD